MAEYMRAELEDTYGILKLQDKILEIMVYIDEFCREHGIVYYLMGGSALGAARHGGFIPWDDDLDIFMTYDNYMKFAACCEKYLDKDKYYFQREDSDENPYFFSKLRMKGTTCITPVVDWGHLGIFVDIMCLNNAPDSVFLRKVQYYSAALIKARSISKTKYKTNSVSKKVVLLISKCFVRGFIKKWLLHNVRKYNENPTESVAHVFGRAKFANSFYPARLFAVPRRVPFETVFLNAPCGMEEYLVLRYGEKYMEMPDEKTKALYQTHATFWDVDRDYTEYLNGGKNVCD